MKPLDEHVRDASAAWLDEARPTLQETEERIAAQLGGPSWKAYVAGGTVLLVLSGVMTWMVMTTPEASDTPMPISEQVATPRTSTPSIRPVSPPSANVPESAPAPVATPSSRAQGEDGADRTDRWIANGAQDGFTAEYERVLARAIQFERTDPLRAATEYLGLGRLCMKRKQYAHAVSALQRAEELVRRGQFTHLAQDVRQQLDEAERLLAE